MEFVFEMNQPKHWDELFAMDSMSEERRIGYFWTYMMMMIDTEPIKPCKSALLSTTSMKPSRKRPRRNENSPVYEVHDELSCATQRK